ncbi:MAG: hypothetical protein JJT78_14960 [Leptospira sp.]|nr:hypothetical protein [Leptospira sp.]
MILFFLLILIFATTIAAILYFYDKKKSKIKNSFFYFGILYLIMGIPLILSFFALVGMSLALVGAGFLFLSKMRQYESKKFKVLGIIPILGLFGFLIYWEAPYANILIPQGYEGRVLIVHNCKNGEPTERENIFRRIYRIGSDGVLHTQFGYHGNFDMNRLDFYSVDDLGDREEIPKYRNGFYEERIGIQWEKAKIYHGFLRNPHQDENHKIMNFILEREVYFPDDYKKEEIPNWYEKMNCD